MASSRKSKTLTVDDTLTAVARLLSSSFKSLDKEAKAIAGRLVRRKVEFKEAEERIERKLRGGIRKTKGDAI